MNINTLFTLEEKKELLLKNGYSLVDYTEDFWYQWGYNDRQGEWQTRKYLCAVKNDESPSIDKEYYKVFEKLVSDKFRKFVFHLS